MQIEDIHALLTAKTAWIPSKDSKNSKLTAYTLWCGNTIGAYCAGQDDSWTAWVFYPGTVFGQKDLECYQYSCKKVAASNDFPSKGDAMSWAETFSRLEC